MTVSADAPVRVRVPATSANLGPGFDALGLALALHDEVTARVTEGGLDIQVDGEGGEQVARDETHLVLRAMRAAFAELGETPPGLALQCRNRIPHGRGLGSSAAAIVAGILLARGLVRDGRLRLDDAAVLALASEFEGHPDNVAPCLLGGLTIAWTVDGAARAVRRDLDPAVVPVVLVPPFTASTERARGLLPPTVPHADAAFTAGRAALLVAALTGTPQALFDATADRLHQAYREPAMPEALRLVADLRVLGHPAVVSGAGPTVLVLARGEVEAERVRGAAPIGWAVSAPAVDVAGARILDPPR
ncbi:homoserine kinase [Jatrophihabitans endophyticus]|uniref:Homoserine kinase n=1 Tax=Jatrophihabitans endophyticus TaxID=1206085 RepID=A0A1M5DM41_9ACTN|nr:homoserine kinase [Jatrophihabitans endophyticus]SHF67842.1 homoserine kinase [Jatrophihabitans endophyticus]